MKTRKKHSRLLCMLICVAMIFSQMSLPAYAEDDVIDESQLDQQSQELTVLNEEEPTTISTIPMKEVGSDDTGEAYNENTYFTIENVEDWDAFVSLINGGKTFSGKTVLLTQDISIEKSAGEGFCGTFDGQGNIITTEITWDNEGVASPSATAVGGLFDSVGSGAYLKNFILKGSVQTTYTAPEDDENEATDSSVEPVFTNVSVGGIIGQVSAAATIENIMNGVDVNAPHACYGGVCRTSSNK